MSKTYRKHAKIVVGDVVNELTVLRPAKNCKYLSWLCSCTCGHRAVVKDYTLKSGRAKSCGHLRFRGRVSGQGKHGLPVEHPLYQVWTQMVARTTNKNNADYAHCGALGIVVHKPWLKSMKLFESWVKSHLGLPKDNETIRRIDISGNFEPCNMERAVKHSRGGKRAQPSTPEMVLIKLLDGRTFKYNGTGKRRYGQPISSDFVVPSIKLLIQVDGCYWHGCEKHHKHRPKAQRRKMQKHDARLAAKAISHGWHVLRFWEHSIKKDPARVVHKIQQTVTKLKRKM